MANWGRWAVWAMAAMCAGSVGTARGAPLVPDQRGEVVPDRAFDLQKLVLDVELQPEARTVVGRAVYHLSRLGPGPLVLDQVDLAIQDVRAGDQPVQWWVRGDSLVVALPEGPPGVRPPPVEVRWTARPRTGMHFRIPGPGSPDRYAEVWTQGEPHDHRHWFPGYDHPNDRFAYEGTVRAPEGWRVHTNSGPDLVNYLVMVAAGTYVEHLHPADSQLKLWVGPGTSADAVDRVFEPLPQMKQLFESRTGTPFPWGAYLQVYAQRFLYGGMENTGATINDADQLVDDRVGHRLRTERVVAHELAHQWFGDLLTCRTFRELWLNEGFASFMEAEWEGHAHGPHAFAARVDGWHRSSIAGPALAGRFFHAPNEPDSGSVYGKGPLVLHMLRVMLGEQTWWEGVRRYVSRHRNQLVETHDLRVVMEEVSGRDLGWFFQQWVELASVPRLTVRDTYRSGMLQITIEQHTAPDRPAFTLPITVAVGRGDGQEERVTGWLTGNHLDLSLPLTTPPVYVSFDPDGGVLADVTQTQDPSAWEAQALRGSPLAQRRALSALAQTDAGAAAAAILARAGADGTERHHRIPLREAAAATLGEQRASAALLVAAADPSDRVRAAVAAGLGKVDAAEARARLDAMVRRDANPDVRAAALLALRGADPGVALVHARRLARLRDTEERELRGAATQVIGALGTHADLPLLLDPTGPGRTRTDGLHAAVALCQRLEGDERESAAAATARFGARLLTDDDLRTRQSAGAALGALGHRDALAALEVWRRWERDPDARAAAAASAAAVRRGAPPPERAPVAVEAEVEALTARVAALEEELRAFLKAGAPAPIVMPAGAVPAALPGPTSTPAVPAGQSPR